jgi:hypothetical protein
MGRKRSKVKEYECVASSEAPRFVKLTRCPPLLPPGSERGFASAPAQLKPEVRCIREDDESPTMLLAAPILTQDECCAWIEWGERTGFALEQLAQTSTTAHRHNWRLAIVDDGVASSILHRLGPWLPSTCAGRQLSGCNSNIRLYKYEQGQRFGRHVDQSNRLADGSVTEFTVLIYLNDDGLKGGETVFYGSCNHEVFRFAPRAGSVLIHAHGLRCLTHEGAEVTQGAKYVLRTDVAYR